MYKLPIENLDLNKIDIFEQLVKATESLGILKGTLNKLPNPNIILNVITLKEAKESSEIENIITTYDELYKEMILKDKSNLNAKEVLNYKSAINLGNHLVQEKNMITTNMINEIHHLIEPNKGDIRKQGGTVIMNTRTGEILHIPPQNYEEIIEYLKNLEEFINLENKINPLIKMALIHLQFEMIHPYYDGNGRTGRVLNLMYLKLSDKLDTPILYLSKYIIENRSEYYNLLNKAGKSKKDILEFIIYMLKAIEKTSKYTLTLIDNIIDAMNNTKKILKDKLPKIYSKDLLELLFFEFYTKNEYIRAKLNISRQTATSYLKQLEEVGILSSEKIGKEIIYKNISLFKIAEN